MKRTRLLICVCLALGLIATIGVYASNLLREKSINETSDKPFVIENQILTKWTGDDKVVDLMELVKTYPELADITAIGDEAFKDNMTIDTVVISKNIQSIGTSAFEGCKSLSGVEFDNSYSYSPITIGANAFANCSKLEEIHFPGRTSNISSYVLKGCTSLKKVSFVFNSYRFNMEENAFAEMSENLESFEIRSPYGMNYSSSTTKFFGNSVYSKAELSLNPYNKETAKNLYKSEVFTTAFPLFKYQMDHQKYPLTYYDKDKCKTIEIFDITDNKEMTDSDSLSTGHDIRLTITPKEGYVIKGIKVRAGYSDVQESDSNTITFKMADESCRVVPTFWPILTYAVKGGHATIKATYGYRQNMSSDFTDEDYPSGKDFEGGYDTRFVFTVTPDEGYRIKHWYINGEIVAHEYGNTLTVPEPQGILNVEAELELGKPTSCLISDNNKFSLDIHDITLNKDLKVNDPIEVGDSVQVKVNVIETYAFISAKVHFQNDNFSGPGQFETPEFKFKMPEKNLVINVVTTPRIFFGASGGLGGNITCQYIDDDNSIDTFLNSGDPFIRKISGWYYSDKLTFKATPSEGFIVRKWTINGKKVQDEDLSEDKLTYTIEGEKIPNGPLNVYCVFEKKDGKGTVTIEKNNLIKSYIITKEDGSEITSTENIPVDTKLNIEFSCQKQYQLFSYEVYKGDSQSPTEIIRFDKEVSKFSFPMYDDNIRIKLNVYPVLICRYMPKDTNGYLQYSTYKNGKVTPGNYGYEGINQILAPEIIDSICLTTPDWINYKVTQWVVNDVKYDGSDAFMISDFSKPLTVDAYFGEKTPEHNLSIIYQNKKDEEKGSVEIHYRGLVLRQQAACQEGEKVILTAKPAEGYKVKSWIINKQEFIFGKTVKNDLTLSFADTANIVSFIMPKKNVDVMVNFELQTYPIVFDVLSGSGKLTATVDGKEINSKDEFTKGTKLIFNAIPDKDFKVEKWVIDGKEIENNASNTYELTVDGLAHKVEVAFIKKQFMVEAKATIEGCIIKITRNDNEEAIESGSLIEIGTELTFTLQPIAEQYRLDGWKINGTPKEYAQDTPIPNSISVTLNEENIKENKLLVEALISDHTSITDIQSHDEAVYGRDGKIFIKSAIGTMISIYDLNGKKVYCQKMTEDTLDVYLPNGMYIVNINKRSVKVFIK